MAKLQRYFIQFHDAIKLDDENEILRQKRDIVLDVLKMGIKRIIEEWEQETPTFTSFNQGSYAMGTGTVPIDGDYDIDVGLDFDIDIEDYPDPVVVKQWVLDALDGHTKNVNMKNPCVTVQYQIKEEPVFHVDLAVYGHSRLTGATDLFLARGKQHSLRENCVWEPSDPQGLIKVIRERFNGNDWEQFRRVVRYLKRWKDFRFSSDGNTAPVGIGLTLAAYYWFIPEKECIDPLSNKFQYDDLEALLMLIERVIGRFQSVYHDGEWAERLSAYLPVQPFDDPFLRMTNRQMKGFKEKLEKLRAALVEAKRLAEDDLDIIASCEELWKQFGEDFPVPELSETAKPKARAISWSGDSA